MKKSVNIVCSSSEIFIPMCGIMLTSLFENNSHLDIRVYVLSPEHTSVKYQQLVRLGKKYNQNVLICSVPDSFFANYRDIDFRHIALPSLYRLAAALLLPNEVEIACYLDCDIVILGDVSPIFDINLDGYAMAGATDCLYFDHEQQYVNAGVVLLNLNYWRENHLVDKSLAFFGENLQKCLYFDQDVMNYICCGKIADMPIKYNFQFYYICEGFFPRYSEDFQNEVRDAFKHPVTVHYCGLEKPWQFRFRGKPFANSWLRYQLISPWKFIFTFKPCHKPLNMFVKRCLNVIGLRKDNNGIIEEFLG